MRLTPQMAVLIALGGAALAASRLFGAPDGTQGKSGDLGWRNKQQVIFGGINNRGQMVGAYFDFDADPLHGFLMEHDVRTMLDSKHSVLAPGGMEPNAINDRGQIVGYVFTISGDRGFLLSHNVYQTLHIPAARNTEALGINNSGQIVGTFYGRNECAHGFLWRNGTDTLLDDPQARQQHLPEQSSGTEASGINDKGEIVGTYYTAPNGLAHGFLMHRGVYTSIDDPAGTLGTHAVAINNHGDIVGFYDGVSETAKGFLLRSGKFTTLNVPHARFRTMPSGINDQGQIVGSYTDAASMLHGFVLSR